MTGTWRGVSTPPLLSKEIVIDAVNGSAFSGTKTNEVKDRTRSRVTVAITGNITEDNLSFKYGNVLYLKDPANGKWWTCTNCNLVNKLSIHEDSLILSMNIAGCAPQCNGESRYYRLLCEYDSSTQVSLVNLWGTAADVASFSPCKEKKPKPEVVPDIAAEKKRQQQVSDSIALVKKQQQQAEDSLRNALAIAEKARKQFVKDSIALVRKQQQHAEDSLNNALALADKERKQYVKDSIALVKKQQKQAEDSLNNALAVAEQQRRQHVRDSIALVKAQLKRAEDSIALVRAQQKRTEDSLKAIAAVPVQPKPEEAPKPGAKISADTALKTRENVLLQTYKITTPDILIEVFDNAQIDGDRVSIYHNDTLIVKNQMLQKEPITFRVHATATNRMHEFVMIAENLGRIAPNTALMRITAGSQVYRLSIRTDLSTNAKIVFEYDGN